MKNIVQEEDGYPVEVEGAVWSGSHISECVCTSHNRIELEKLENGSSHGESNNEFISLAPKKKVCMSLTDHVGYFIEGTIFHNLHVLLIRCFKRTQIYIRQQSLYQFIAIRP